MFLDLLKQSPSKRDVFQRETAPVPNTGWVRPTYLPELRDASVIAFDTETREFDWDHGPGWGRGQSHAIGVSVSASWSSGQRYKAYFPVRHEVERQDNFDPAIVFDWLRLQLHTPHIPKVGANLLFDCGVLSDEGIYPQGPLYDIQFAEALIDETGRVELGHLGQKYVGRGKNADLCKEWILRSFPQANANTWKSYLWRTPPRLAAPYAEEDADLPLDVLPAQWAVMVDEGTLDLYKMECSGIPMLVRMRRPGIPVDLAFAEDLSVRLKTKTAELYAALRHEYATPIETVGSSTQLAKLFDSAGIPYPTTATGKPSFKKEWLHLLEHPAGKAVNAIRELEKLNGTFLEGYILGRARVDAGSNNVGRIYCSFNPLRDDDHGAKTGRFSSSDPNLQNIPARSAIGAEVRKVFIPEPGHHCWHKKDHCVAPDTSVLTSDMRHIRADRVQIGQELVSFDEHSTADRKLMLSRVTAIKHLKQPCYRITTQRDQIVSSALHRWLAKHGYSRAYEFIATSKLRVGSLIPRLCDTWHGTYSYEDGWFGGLLDGEGWRCYGQLGFAQRPGYVAERAKAWMRRHNFTWTEQPGGMYGDCIKFLINGGRSEQWRMLGLTMPIRLLHNNREAINGSNALHRWNGGADVVTAIEYIGEQDVVGIETTAGTYIANGLLSHNSQIEYRMLANYAVGPKSEEIRYRYCNDPATDFHDDTARDVAAMRSMNVAAMSEDEWGRFRKPIKNVNFGLTYGQTERSLAYKAGWSQEEADQFFTNYHASRPFVKPTMAQIQSEVQAYGFITTILGRRLRFNKWEAFDYEKRKEYGALPQEQAISLFGGSIRRAFAYRGVNYKFQGGAADILKKGMYDCYASGVFEFTGLPKLTVHDELDWSRIDDSKAQSDAYAYITHVMENCVKLSIPLKVDTSEGQNWGKAK